MSGKSASTRRASRESNPARSFGIHDIYGIFIRRHRPKRMRDMAERLKLTPDTRVLDVGGTMTNWNLLPFRPKLTILNLSKRQKGVPADVTYVCGDGC